MNRQQIETLQIGQTGLYAWDRTLPIVELGEVQEVLLGRNKGKVFRYIHVASATGNAKIGFTVAEA